jgi:hypothetical protein
LLDRPSLEAVSLKLYEDRSSGWAKDAAPVGASSLDEVVDELRPPLEQAIILEHKIVVPADSRRVVYLSFPGP